MTKMNQLAVLGQAVWLDYIRRSFIHSGELAELVEKGLRGVTSNPAIFENAIAGSNDYDEALHRLVEDGRSTPEIYEALSQALGRSMPSTEAEASLIVGWLSGSGPFEPTAFHAALAKTVRRLGKTRPLAQILNDLDGQICRPSNTKEP